jgi:hypothetical protein
MLSEQEQDIRDAKKAHELHVRNITIEYICRMTAHDFQKRLLNGYYPVDKLPIFVRSVEGDSDYDPDSLPEFEYEKKIMTQADFDKNGTSFGNANRRKLRYMSDKEYIQRYYPEPEIN